MDRRVPTPEETAGLLLFRLAGGKQSPREALAEALRIDREWFAAALDQIVVDLERQGINGNGTMEEDAEIRFCRWFAGILRGTVSFTDSTKG